MVCVVERWRCLGDDRFAGVLGMRKGTRRCPGVPVS